MSEYHYTNECDDRTAGMTPMSIHWERNEFAILDDPEAERELDRDTYMTEEVVLLRRERRGNSFVEVGHMPRVEAQCIIDTALRHDSYADQLEQVKARERGDVELQRRGFAVQRYEHIGWFRPAEGRERGPKFVLGPDRPEPQRYGWHPLGRVEAP